MKLNPSTDTSTLESEFTHILSTFPIAKDPVKNGALEAFQKMKDSSHGLD